jgi:HK97 gp10 family phage protein
MDVFRIDGAEAIVKKLKALPAKLQDAAGKRSARRAMAIVRSAARAGAQRLDDPTTGESIARNVYLQQSRRQSARVGGVVMRVGIIGGARKGGPGGGPGGDTFYWRFIELGTEKKAARPFLRPALEGNAGAVAQTLIAELNRELDGLAG